MKITKRIALPLLVLGILSTGTALWHFQNGRSRHHKALTAMSIAIEINSAKRKLRQNFNSDDWLKTDYEERLQLLRPFLRKNFFDHHRPGSKKDFLPEGYSIPILNTLDQPCYLAGPNIDEYEQPKFEKPPIPKGDNGFFITHVDGSFGFIYCEDAEPSALISK